MSEQEVKSGMYYGHISGKEKKVKQYIEYEINRLNLQDYVSQVLIPMEKFIR